MTHHHWMHVALAAEGAYAHAACASLAAAIYGLLAWPARRRG